MKKYIFVIIFLLTVSYIPYIAMAQIRLETGLPNIPGGQLPAGDELPNYIRYLFLFGLSSISFLALTRMIIGGIMYILAAGNAAKVEDAKDTIFQALLGVGILLVSYLLLRTINPDLVRLKNPNVTPNSFQFKQFDPRFDNPQSVETLNKCLYNQIEADCEKLKKKECQAVVTDQSDPCYCLQNPTAGFCSTSMF